MKPSGPTVVETELFVGGMVARELGYPVREEVSLKELASSSDHGINQCNCSLLRSFQHCYKDCIHV